MIAKNPVSQIERWGFFVRIGSWKKTGTRRFLLPKDNEFGRLSRKPVSHCLCVRMEIDEQSMAKYSSIRLLRTYGAS
jgi:hypothetical protein